MVDKILIDTNVLLDYLLERKPFFEDCLQMECVRLFCVGHKSNSTK